MHLERPLFRLRVLLVMAGIWLAALSCAGPAAAAAPTPEALADYVLKLYKRALAVANEVIRLEEDLIFRLQTHRQIDLERVAGSFVSGRRQVIFLVRLGRYLERRMTGASSLQSQIQTVKARFPLVLSAHRKNLATLQQLTNGGLLQAIQEFSAAGQPPTPASLTAPLDQGTIEDQF